VCIQGQWSNVVDAKIKGRLAAQAASTESSPYNPLYARASQIPKPWGVTALFAEYTGDHAPVDIRWSAEPETARIDKRVVSVEPAVAPPVSPPSTKPASFGSFWELALAINRSDPSALALAEDGAESHVPVDAMELKKLLGTFWFRSVFSRLSATWKERLFHVLVESAVVPNHVVKVGREERRLSDINGAQLKDLFSKASLPETIRADVRLLMMISNLWGPESLKVFRFADLSQLQGFRT
jgi:hypothetical protein